MTRMNPSAQRARNNRAQKRRSKANTDKGLCKCGKPLQEGRKACTACLASNLAWVTKRRRRIMPSKKTFHLCCVLSCNAEPVPGFSACDYHMDQQAAAQNALRAARVANGTCTRCDAPRVQGRMSCAKHLAQLSQAQARYKQKQRRQKAVAV